MSFPARIFHTMRHAESVANAVGTIAGSYESPLTKIGYLQAHSARRVVEALRIKPTIIVCSNLVRARLTANVINSKLRLPIVESELIAERHFGEWTGMDVSEWRRRREAGLTPPAGEAGAAFERRVIRGVKEVLELNQMPLFITHAGVLRVIIAHLGVNVDGAHNCALHTFIPCNEAVGNRWNVHRDLGMT